jgi:hypothetical protein
MLTKSSSITGVFELVKSMEKDSTVPEEDRVFAFAD